MFTKMQNRLAQQLREKPNTPNARLAKAHGVSYAVVYGVRRELEKKGLPVYRQNKYTKGATAKAIEGLKHNPARANVDIAAEFGISDTTVANARGRLEKAGTISKVPLAHRNTGKHAGPRGKYKPAIMRLLEKKGVTQEQLPGFEKALRAAKSVKAKRPPMTYPEPAECACSPSDKLQALIDEVKRLRLDVLGVKGLVREIGEKVI